MFKAPAPTRLRPFMGSPMRPALRRLAAGLALLALVFAAMAPTISHALATSGGGGAQGLWAEICTAAGAKLVKLNEGGANDPSPVSGDSHFEHCPFCFTHGASHALPPASATVLTLLDTDYAVPSLYLRAPRPLFIWSAALARAPPVLS